jgi:hypothetical protein
MYERERAWKLGGQRGGTLGCIGVTVECDQPSAGLDLLKGRPRVTAAAKCSVYHGDPWCEAESFDGLAQQHGHVAVEAVSGHSLAALIVRDAAWHGDSVPH